MEGTTLTSGDILTVDNLIKESTIPKYVIILGKAVTGRDCPFDADEVWGVNNVADQPEFAGKTIHKLFAFDLLDKDYTDLMKKHAPIMSWQDYGDIKFPLEEVRARFNTDYFTNTVSYMVAYAIYIGVERIGIYGVDVAFGAPYAQENRGVEYWIGRAVEAGIKVEAPVQSQLMRTISGVIYGVKDACNVMLYLHERINLINALPREGHYSDALKAQNAWWVLFPKEDEAKAHGVIVQRSPDGNMSFGFKNPDQLKAEGTPDLKAGEYLFDCHLPPEVWVFLRDILRDTEAKGKMSFGLLTAYEKLILAKPDGGN